MIASRYHALSGAVAVGRQVVGEAVGSGTPTCCLAALAGGGGRSQRSQHSAERHRQLTRAPRSRAFRQSRACV